MQTSANTTNTTDHTMLPFYILSSERFELSSTVVSTPPLFKPFKFINHTTWITFDHSLNTSQDAQNTLEIHYQLKSIPYPIVE